MISGVAHIPCGARWTAQFMYFWEAIQPRDVRVHRSQFITQRFSGIFQVFDLFYFSLIRVSTFRVLSLCPDLENFVSSDKF